MQLFLRGQHLFKAEEPTLYKDSEPSDCTEPLVSNLLSGYTFHWLGVLPLWVREDLTCSMVYILSNGVWRPAHFLGWKHR